MRKDLSLLLLIALVLSAACKKETTIVEESTAYVTVPDVQMIYPFNNYAWKGGVLEIEGANLAGCTVTLNGGPITDSTGWISNDEELVFRLPRTLVGNTVHVAITKNNYTYTFDRTVSDDRPHPYFTPSSVSLARRGRPRWTFIRANWANSACTRADYTDLDTRYEAFYFCDQFDPIEGNSNDWISTGNSIVHIDSTSSDWDYTMSFTCIVADTDIDLILDVGARFSGSAFEGDDGERIVFLRSLDTGLPVILRLDPDSSMADVPLPFPECQ